MSKGIQLRVDSGKCTEPVYENVPLPRNSKDIRSRTSNAQLSSETKAPISKVLQQVQPVRKEITVEKTQNEVLPMKNNTLDVSSSSNNSSQVISTTIIHSAEQSFDSSNQSSSREILKKEGRSENHQKWQASVGNEQRFYIATQTPLPSTVNHFWQMVWEAGVHLVLDLSLPKINTIDKNYGNYYFPTVADHSIQFGETIQGIPTGQNRNLPILVHCSTGVGRTGLAVLTDILSYSLDHNKV
ncbi:receptor-type tyrosine-protein phosphatase N2-like [Rhopalosiphum maidis]|uniref:receptor-type tyrosine-protein phosphatase N2-like n=1 Tax=Rhopalosiphum maidis TaxID=43146 RepID=UPI000EFEEF64|nr:receptor-type tyrosine-protein phosphatase N2-like [Rhopalosiphum maidis]